MKSFNIEQHMEMIYSQFGSFYRTFHYFERVWGEWKEVFQLTNREIRQPVVARIRTEHGEELVTETYQQELVFDEERIFSF
jgi:hypothetical protein